MNEDRVDRARQSAAADAIDRIDAGDVTRRLRFVGRIVNLGAMPSGPGLYVTVNPVVIGGTECEGCTPTLTVDSTSNIVVLMLRGSPLVGNYLICEAVDDGRWASAGNATISEFVSLFGVGPCSGLVSTQSLAAIFVRCTSPVAVTVTKAGTTIASSLLGFSCSGAGTYVVAGTSMASDVTITPAFFTVVFDASCHVTSLTDSTGHVYPNDATQIAFRMVDTYDNLMYLCGCSPCGCSFPNPVKLTTTGTLPDNVTDRAGHPLGLNPASLFVPATFRLTRLPDYPTYPAYPTYSYSVLPQWTYVSDETPTVTSPVGAVTNFKLILTCGSGSGGPTVSALPCNYPAASTGPPDANYGKGTSIYREVNNLGGTTVLCNWAGGAGTTCCPLLVNDDTVSYVQAGVSITAAEKAQYAGFRMTLSGDCPPMPMLMSGEPPASPENARLAMLADLCSHGTGACGCGAEPRSCDHPDHPNEVFRPYCLACPGKGT